MVYLHKLGFIHLNWQSKIVSNGSKNLMFFLFLQTNNTSPKKSNSPVKVPAYRSVSPTRQLERPTSPFKPHPLQFVSPQKAQEPPVKPPRYGNTGCGVFKGGIQN